MQPRPRAAFESEIASARAAEGAARHELAMYHLERAHGLGLRPYGPHLRSHYGTLRTGRRRDDAVEVRGQLLRLLASVGSLFGAVPIGNTGRARAPALRPMPIPADLLARSED